MDKKNLLEKDKPLWKQSPSIRRDAKKATEAIRKKFKIFKYIFPLILLVTLPHETKAQANTLEQNTIFFMEEVCKMASEIKNLQVAIFSKLSTFLNQGKTLGTFFNNSANIIPSKFYSLSTSLFKGLMTTLTGTITPTKTNQIQKQFKDIQFRNTLLVKVSRKHVEKVKAMWNKICYLKHTSVTLAKIISVICDGQKPNQN